jgi:hypothetical protein
MKLKGFKMNLTKEYKEYIINGLLNKIRNIINDFKKIEPYSITCSNENTINEMQFAIDKCKEIYQEIHKVMKD